MANWGWYVLGGQRRQSEGDTDAMDGLYLPAEQGIHMVSLLPEKDLYVPMGHPLHIHEEEEEDDDVFDTWIGSMGCWY